MKETGDLDILCEKSIIQNTHTTYTYLNIIVVPKPNDKITHVLHQCDILCNLPQNWPGI